MSLCPSGLLMSALSLTIIIFDIYNKQYNYIFIHSILGCIISILFFTMCNYGLEMINWIILGVIPVYILFTWIFKKQKYIQDDFSERDSCEACKEPTPCNVPNSCKEPRPCKAPVSCKEPTSCKAPVTCKAPVEPKSCKQPSSYKKPSELNKNESLSCPVKPMRLGTQCGISRFT